MYPKTLSELVSNLRKLPGVGKKTAERFAFSLIDWSESDQTQFAKLLQSVKDNLARCEECGCLIEKADCKMCNSKRNQEALCVVSSAKDVFTLEEARVFEGVYHVLNGLLSPLEGKGPETLQIDGLKERIKRLGVKEIIIALDSTIEGDATALYLKGEAESWGLVVSRLALGMPLGSSLDYVDEGTLGKAFIGRHSF